MTHVVMEEGHIYVLGFSDKSVKVGRTTDSKAEFRIAMHKKVAKTGAATLTKSWISEQHGDSNLTERKLIEFCRQHGQKHRGNEWFSGVSYETVLKFAQGLELAPSRKHCWCGRHTWPASSEIPPRWHLEGFIRKDLGLLIQPILELKFPGEPCCATHQMNEVEKVLVRHLTAKADFEFLLQQTMKAWEILKGIEAEIENGVTDV
jgi:hypothetical protein